MKERDRFLVCFLRGESSLCILTGIKVILISTGWANAEGDDPVGTMTTNVANRVKAAARELGVSHSYMYAGYARAGQDEEIFAGYGEKNLRRLREVQKSVDPEGIFTSRGLWRGHLKLL